MGSQDKNKCSACEGEQVILENVSRDLALMRFLQLQQCGEFPVMCETVADCYTVCRQRAAEAVSASFVA